MPKFLLAKWRGEGPHWFRHESQGALSLAECPSIGVYRGNVAVEFETEAETLEEAKIKFEVGATKFEYVNKGKCLYDEGLTVGDRNAIRRTTDLILKQLSDEAVKFLITIAGCIPAGSPVVQREQLTLMIIKTKNLTAAEAVV